MSFDLLLSKISVPAVREVALHWNTVRGQKRMPAWSDINPAAIARHLPIIWSWKYDFASDTFTGRLAGEQIVYAIGGSFRGKTSDEFFQGRDADAMLESARRVVRDPCFFFGKDGVYGRTRRVIAGERAAFPLSDDGIVADGIFGVTYYPPPETTAEARNYPETEHKEFIPL